MGFARAILAALIAISIAFLPATGSASAASKPVEASSSDSADMPCCPSCDTQADYKSCALKCAALSGAVLPAMTIVPPYIGEGSLSALAENVLHTHVITPTHPPPI
jgi:hypothetical protein